MKRLTALILSWLLVAVPVCGTAAEAPLSSALQQGKELYQSGHASEALALLRSHIQQQQLSAQTAPVYALIARILIEQQQYADALTYLQQVPQYLHSPEIELLTGLALVNTGKEAEGAQLLHRLADEPLAQADRSNLFNALALAAQKRNQPLQALFYLQQQLPQTTNPAAVLEQAHQLLQSKLPATDLSEAAFMWQGTAIGQDARLQLARRALAEQQPEQAKQHLAQLYASQVTFPYWHEAQAMRSRLDGNNVLNRDTIGILIPLSGRYATYGQLVKNGIELALKEHNQTHLPMRFVYRDSATAGVSADQLVSELSDDDKVMGIIGPLLSSNAESAARRAQQEMVPLLSLSQGEGIPEIGQFVFRDILTPAQQVKALVQYAMASNHLSFSILYPQSRLGKQMTALFMDEVRHAGGEIVDSVSYAEESTDFKKEVEKLLRRDQARPLSQRLRAQEQEDLEYPPPPFHALFIPDFADRISLIAPQLVFYGIKDVTLLGINGWNSQDLAKRAGRFLKDAVFVDAYFAESSQATVRNFVAKYQESYGEVPSILEAQGYEAAHIMLQSLNDPAISNREQLRQKLMSLHNYAGISSTTGFDSFGEAEKQLQLLGFKDNTITELQPR